MTRTHRGGYVFITWIGDHEPRNVHVLRNGVLVLKWNLDKDVPMRGILRPSIVALIHGLQQEGRL